MIKGLNNEKILKLVKPYINTILRDPKKRAYIEKVLMETGDISFMQKYFIARMTGKWVDAGEVIDLEEPGDIELIFKKLESIETRLSEIEKKLEGK